MSGLSVSLVGPPVVTLDGAALHLPRRKVLALLAYLAVTNRAHSRDELAELLYPERDREQAYSNLRQTLSSLRAEIGDRWIEAGRSSVALAAGGALSVDVLALRSAAGSDSQEKALLHAAGLVRGRFMENFSLRDSPLFEEWQEQQADEVRRNAFTVIDRLVERHERRGEYGEAAQECRRLLGFDPVEEATHRRLMRLYARDGQKAEALRQYERCRRSLEKELGERPSPETEEVRRLVVEGTGKTDRPAAEAMQTRARKSPRSRPWPFFGRRGELRAGRALLSEAREGRGALFLVAGEAGVGKTRLLEEVASAPEAAGMRVAWGRAHVGGGVPPYWPWRQVLEALVRGVPAEAVARWAGAGEPVLNQLLEAPLSSPRADEALDTTESGRFRLHESITRFLLEAAREAPLLIVLEDLHGADDGSLDALEYLAHELATAPVIVLASCRPVDADPAHRLFRTIGGLARERAFRRLALDPLGRSDAGALASAAAGRRLGRESLDELWEKTQGNPLFVVTMARDSELSGGMAVPSTLRALVLRQLDGLSPACRELTCTAAALGARLEVDLVGRSAGLPRSDVEALLHEAATAGVVEIDTEPAGKFRFSHPLVQECLASEVTGRRRAELHASIAAAIEGSAKADAIEIAYHLEQARAVIEPARLAAACLVAGEEALAAFDYEKARRLCTLGLQARGSACDAETARLHFGLARSIAPQRMFLDIAESNGTDDESAWVHLLAAFETLRAAGDTDAAVRVAMFPLLFRDPVTGDRKTLFDESLALVKPGSAAEAVLYLNKALESSFFDGDGPAPRAFFERASSMARSCGEQGLLLRVLAGRLAVTFSTDEPRLVAGQLATALEILRQVDDPVIAFTVHTRAYHAAMIDGQLPEADHQVELAAASAHRLRDTGRILLGHLMRVELERARGNWAALRAASDSALAMPPDAVLWWQHASIRAWFELELGKAAVARHWMGIFRAELERRGVRRDISTAVAVGPLAHYGWLAGDADLLALSRRAARAWFPTGSEEDVPPGVYGRPNAAFGFRFLTAVLKDRPAAERLCRWIDQRPHRCIPGLEVTTPEVRGLLAGVLGDHETAVNCLGETLDGYRRAGMETLRGWACFELADALLARRKAGDLARARDVIAEGQKTAHALGLKALQRRLAALDRHAAK